MIASYLFALFATLPIGRGCIDAPHRLADRQAGHFPIKLGVVFDFASVPEIEGDITIQFEFEGIKIQPWTYKGGLPSTEDWSVVFSRSLKTPDVRYEIISQTKVRVIGNEVDGKYYPAVGATVTSKTLKLEQLPKATFIKKSRVNQRRSMMSILFTRALLLGHSSSIQVQMPPADAHIEIDFSPMPLKIQPEARVAYIITGAHRKTWYRKGDGVLF